MGIQPIDLQTLYTQLDKVSKDVAFQHQGVQLRNAIQQEKAAQRLQEKQQAVEQTKSSDDGLQHIHDQPGGSQAQQQESEKKHDEQTDLPGDADGDSLEVLKDPALGKNIDVWG